MFEGKNGISTNCKVLWRDLKPQSFRRNSPLYLFDIFGRHFYNLEDEGSALKFLFFSTVFSSFNSILSLSFRVSSLISPIRLLDARRSSKSTMIRNCKISNSLILQFVVNVTNGGALNVEFVVYL